MESVMTSITGAGTTIAGYVATGMGAGITLGILVFGGRKAWKAFKALSN